MEDMEYTSFEIGKQFPLFEAAAIRLKGQTGAFFEALDDNYGYIYSIYYPAPTALEISSIGSLKMNMKLYKGEDNMILPLLRFGNSKHLTFEMIFDPTVYDDDRAFQFVDDNNSLKLFLMDSNTNQIKAMRYANFPLKLIQECKTAWAKAVLDIDHSDKYKRWYNKVQAKYDVYHLWEVATYMGKMGDDYDPRDIKIPILGR